jgi:hypothetical protein
MAPQFPALLSCSPTAVLPSKCPTVIESVTYPINTGAPTFPHRESPYFHFLFSSFFTFSTGTLTIARNVRYFPSAAAAAEAGFVARKKDRLGRSE